MADINYITGKDVDQLDYLSRVVSRLEKHLPRPLELNADEAVIRARFRPGVWSANSEVDLLEARTWCGRN